MPSVFRQPRLSPPQRLVPTATFPAYSYVPGKFPHPTRDPLGHSHGKVIPQPDAIDPNRWGSCHLYLWGIDLFNHGYYWEAHEAWEALWHAAGRRGPLANFLKGLIALAAAGVKAREGRVAGVRGHAIRAQEIFKNLENNASLAVESAARKRVYLGLDVASIAAEAKHLAESAARVIDTSDVPVAVVMPFALSIEAVL